MRIKELMSLEIFKTSKLLTGEIGLENEVDSAMVLEAIDIEKWSKQNQLILTSFYAFNNLEEKELTDFFEKMHNIGISGLVVKMDRLIKMIPEWLIDLCFEFQIPLIKVEQDLTYEKIMLAIYEPMLNYQSHVLRTYYDVRQRFTKIERNLSSFDQIMREFHLLIKKDCALKIPDRGINITYGTLNEELVVTRQTTMKNTEFTKNHYELLTLFSQKSAQEITALKAEILNQYTDKCILLVYQTNADFKETDLMIIENAIDILQEKLQMEYLIKKDRFTRLNNLADAILQNTPGNLDELNSLLNEADMNSYPYYQGVAFSTNTLTSKLLQKEIRNSLRTLKEHVIFFEHHNYLVLLYNLASPEQAIQKNELKRMFKDVFDEYEELTFAVSSVKKKEELKAVLIECLDTIRFNQAFYIDQVVTVSELGIFRYFMDDNQLEAIEKLIPSKLVALSLENYDLFETLYTFFKSNRNYKKTAETMFLHSKTIRYRLNKIEDYLEIDLTNPTQVLNFEIGAYLLKMKKS